MAEYDSTKDTMGHKEKVKKFMNLCIDDLVMRAENHDNSKLESPEKKYFDEYSPKLKDCTYGSDDYQKCLDGLKPALDHHYKVNSHHPEHYKNGVNGMTLVDLLELICDWKASSMRHEDGDINRSIEVNKDRFKLSDQLVDILKNTVKEYF